MQVILAIIDIYEWSLPQIREQMLVPDLCEFALKFGIPQQLIKMD